MNMPPSGFDRHHLWHPYSNILNPGPTYKIKKAKGTRLTLEDNSQMIDAMSSWWCAIHGYGHPVMADIMGKQLKRMPHVMFGGLTHDPAIKLGEKLLDMVPSSMNRIFYCDSGSVAVEIALKMALQYQHACNRNKKTQFLTIRSGYYGDTWKAMSVCDPVTGMHHIFRGALDIQYFVERPPIRIDEKWNRNPEENGLGNLESILEKYHEKIAALILEPVAQGAGGMYFYHPQYLNQAHELCKKFNTLLIFDEIATGFGRTGKMFATQHTRIEPDIMCIGKALTGGAMSFAATLTSDRVAEGIASGNPGVFMHGPTFMANPLACAASIASLDILASTSWQESVMAIEKQLKNELAPARKLPGVVDVRALGAIGVIEMDHTVNTEQAHKLCRETGVWLRPFGHNIYCMPAFIITPDDLSQICSAMLRLAQTL